MTYAKQEKEVGNVAAARIRLQKKQKTNKAPVLEGKRATKDKSGGSGFKIAKKRGKMRLLQTTQK